MLLSINGTNSDADAGAGAVAAAVAAAAAAETGGVAGKGEEDGAAAESKGKSIKKKKRKEKKRKKNVTTVVSPRSSFSIGRRNLFRENLKEFVVVPLFGELDAAREPRSVGPGMTDANFRATARALGRLSNFEKEKNTPNDKRTKQKQNTVATRIRPCYVTSIKSRSPAKLCAHFNACPCRHWLSLVKKKE